MAASGPPPEDEALSEDGLTGGRSIPPEAPARAAAPWLRTGLAAAAAVVVVLLLVLILTGRLP
jgi:hypothetical protein